MSSNQGVTPGTVPGGVGSLPAAGLVARLHETLDALLGLDLAEVAEADLPGLVTGLVQAGHRVHAAQLDAVAAFDTAGLAETDHHP